MNMRLDNEALKDRVLEIVGSLKSGKASCVFHEDSGNPNMHFYEDGVHCFSCGAHENYGKVLSKLTGESLESIYREYGERVSTESLYEDLEKVLTDPEYGDIMLQMSVKARMRRTEENFNDIEHELRKYDVDL